MIVVDASVAAKWLLKEDRSEEAAGLLTRRSGELLGPDILLAEVTGAIVRRANAGEASADDALTTLHNWDRLVRAGAVELHRLSAAMMLAAGQLAIGLRHPVKDCIYLALAIEQGAVLVTADLRLIDKGRRAYPDILSLAELADGEMLG